MQEFKLIPGRKWEPAFKTREEEERFRAEFAAAVKPELDRLAEARRKSEEAAMHHYVY